MKKILEYEGDEALDVVVDMMAAIVPLMRDEEVLEGWKENVMKGFQVARKKHPKEFKDFLACYCRVEPDELDCSPVNVINMIGGIVSDKVIMSFFSLPSRKMDSASSGSATENTEAEEE